MIATNIKLQYNSQQQPEIVLTIRGDPKNVINESQAILDKGKELNVEIKQHRAKRSLDSNGYLWLLCQKLSEKMTGHSKEDIYKEAIRKVGQFEYLAVTEEASEQFIKVWNSRGLGWYAEELDSKIEGCKKIIAYYGSSVYDTKAMTVLINYIVEECKAQGIETLTAEELTKMNADWGK